MKKFKWVLTMALVLGLVLSLAACTSTPSGSTATDGDAAGDKTAMTPGEYTATATGYGGDVTLVVTVDQSKITKIEVTEHKETDTVGGLAIESLPGEIIDKQSLSVDSVAGATRTSDAIFEAVAQAITDAGGKPDEFKTAAATDGGSTSSTGSERPTLGSPSIPTTWDESYEIVVVGSGFAGLAAAERAATMGANTLMIEKMPMMGGNSKINGGVYAAYTSNLAAEFQAKFNLTPDTAEQHIEDTIKGGDYMSQPDLVKNMVYGSPFMLNRFLDNGLKVRESLTMPGGHYGYRTYTLENGVGEDLVKVQIAMLEKTDCKTAVDTTMTQIYRDTAADNKVVGIRVETKDGVKNIEATKAVILCTGGFGANIEMRLQQVPTLTSDVPTTNHVGATGEAISMAQEIGANTMQMSYIQLYPFADPNTGILDAYAVIPFSGPSSGVVYVDINGERYVNERDRRDVCATAAQNSGGFPTFCILNEKIVTDGGFVSAEQLANGLAADRIFKADTLEELAEEINKRQYTDSSKEQVSINMTGATLAKTIADHNGYVTAGNDPDFNKPIDDKMIAMTEGPYYAIPQWPSVHHTMGGLTITKNTEVLDIWGNVIPNLFAAGEVTGGVHGTNRLGSNAIADAVSNGYYAGQYSVDGTVPEFMPAE